MKANKIMFNAIIDKSRINTNKMYEKKKLKVLVKQPYLSVFIAQWCIRLTNISLYFISSNHLSMSKINECYLTEKKRNKTKKRNIIVYATVNTLKLLFHIIYFNFNFKFILSTYQ